MEGHVDRQEKENAIIRTANRRGGVDGTPAPLPPQLTKAYSHNICGVCGISRYYAGVVETECELRGEQHVWTYRDPALSVTERRDAHFTPLMEALRYMVTAFSSSTTGAGPQLWHRAAALEKAEAALDAAKEA